MEQQREALSQAGSGKKTSRKTHVHLSPAKKEQLLTRLAVNKANPTRRYISELCTEYDVSRSTIHLLWRRHVTESKNPTHPAITRKAGSGRPEKITPEMGLELVSFARTQLYHFSFKDAAALLYVSESTVRRYLQTHGWRTTRIGLRPQLTQDHKARRLQWAKDHHRSTFSMNIDIDEKWFYTIDRAGKLRVPPGDIPSRQPIQHSSHIPKVMALVAVARPESSIQFSGMVGYWRVGERSVAKRNSKNRPAGTPVFVDKSMDSSRFLKMMKELVIPRVRKVYPRRHVVIQMDNAPGHASRQTIEELKAHLDTLQPPNIRIDLQPAQSPDTNVLDLAVFPSLGAKVRELQHGCHPYDKDRLWQNVAKICRKSPSELISKAFDSKMRVVKEIIWDKGGNSFSIPHNK